MNLFSIGSDNGLSPERPLSKRMLNYHQLDPKKYLIKIGNFPFTNAMDAMGRGKPGEHDDVIKWKRFPRDWSPVNSPHIGQWRGALMFSFICVWINDWVNNREAGDLRSNRIHYDVTVMVYVITSYYRNTDRVIRFYIFDYIGVIHDTTFWIPICLSNG